MSWFGGKKTTNIPQGKGTNKGTQKPAANDVADDISALLIARGLDVAKSTWQNSPVFRSLVLFAGASAADFLVKITTEDMPQAEQILLAQRTQNFLIANYEALSSGAGIKNLLLNIDDAFLDPFVAEVKAAIDSADLPGLGKILHAKVYHLNSEELMTLAIEKTQNIPGLGGMVAAQVADVRGSFVKRNAMSMAMNMPGGIVGWAINQMLGNLSEAQIKAQIKSDLAAIDPAKIDAFMQKNVYQQKPEDFIKEMRKLAQKARPALAPMIAGNPVRLKAGYVPPWQQKPTP